MSLVRKRKAAASVLLMLTFNEEEETVHAKRGKTRKWIKRREEKGYFNNIVEELRVEDGTVSTLLFRVSLLGLAFITGTRNCSAFQNAQVGV